MEFNLKKQTMKTTIKLLLITLLFIASSCVRVAIPYTYKIVYLESDITVYVDKLQKFDEFPEDALVYKYVNGKYIRIIQIYE